MRTDLLAKRILERLKSLDKDTDKTNLIKNYLDMVIRDGHKPSDFSELLCARIVDELFTNDIGEKAKRLVLELENGRNGGGWCKEAVRDLILRHMGV